MKTEKKVKRFESSLIFQTVTLVFGLVITFAFLVLEPSLQTLVKYMSLKGLWVAGMVSLVLSSFLGIINKDKRFSQNMIFLSLVLLITLLLKQIL